MSEEIPFRSLILRGSLAYLGLSLAELLGLLVVRMELA